MKILRKLDTWVEKLGTCPKCKHNTAGGVDECVCTDKGCSCNPVNQERQQWG